MGPKEWMELYNLDMVGRTPTVVTIREHISGDKEMEEPGEMLPKLIDPVGMEVETPGDENFVSAITFNTKITKTE